MVGNRTFQRLCCALLIGASALLVAAASPGEEWAKRYAEERRDMVQRLESYAAALTRAQDALVQAEQAMSLARELKDDQALQIAIRAKISAEAAIQRVLRYQSNQRERLRTFEKRSNYLIDARRVEYVSRFKGAVSRSGGKDLDAPLAPGDTLTTGHDGYVEISFLGGSSMTLGPNTTLRLLEVDEVTYHQARGTIYHLIRCLKSRDACAHRRVTPGGAVAVRGTAFEVDVADDGSTVVRTFEGKVSFTPNRDGAPEVDVPAGRQIVVAKDGRVSGQGPAGQAKAANWKF